MPLAGVVINRVHRSAVHDLSAGRAQAVAESLQTDESSGADGDLASGVLRAHAHRMAQQGTEGKLLAAFAMTHPRVRSATVPAFAGDVHDLAGLRALATALCEPATNAP